MNAKTYLAPIVVHIRQPDIRHTTSTIISHAWRGTELAYLLYSTTTSIMPEMRLNDDAPGSRLCLFLSQALDGLRLGRLHHKSPNYLPSRFDANAMVEGLHCQQCLG